MPDIPVPDGTVGPATSPPAGGGGNDLLTEGLGLAERAGRAGISLRFIGSLAVQLTCPRWRHLAAELGRRPSVDIDFVGYAKEQNPIEKVFAEAGYDIHPAVRYSQEYGVKRLIFVSAADRPKVDVFLDDLIMAHTVAFAGRLDLSSPTVSLVDLLLSKLQIHEMTRNDLVDLVILLAEHEVRAQDAGGQRNAGGQDAGIDGDHFGRVMGRDWGFSYSASLNLTALLAALDEFPRLPAEADARVRTQVASLRRILETAPKSPKWRLRARVGPRLRWYEEVSEVT